MTSLPLHLHVRTDTGRLREQNEDSVGQLAVSDGQLVVVSDGMGGHQAGDVASQITIREVVEHVRATVGEDPRERLYIAIEKAHTAVRTHAAAAGTLDMGCTVVACFVQDGEAHVAHVGDSRLYLIRQGRVSWATRDHTRVRFLVDAGLLSEADAENHPEGNVITRAVGHDPADLDGGFVVDVRNAPIRLLDGDTLLLCSDGLYDMVPDREILSILGDRSARAAVDLLVDRANEADRFGNEPGGYDNITVAILQFGDDRGSVASYVDEDTLKPGGNPTPDLPTAAPPSVHAQPPPSPYQPVRSTLVPEPTLDDATMTLPEQGIDSPEPGVGTGTTEIKAPRPRAVASSVPTATVEVARLRRVNVALVLLVASLLIVLGWLASRFTEAPPSTAGPESATSAPIPGGDE
jgi:serine/threonine protein phosphatase PrpC